MAKSKMHKISGSGVYRAALYIRVSTDRQAEEGYSIDVQKERLVALTVQLALKPTLTTATPARLLSVPPCKS